MARTVLVVEDEPLVVRTLLALLLQAGWKVVTATDGAAGVETFNAHRADIALVLTDISMTGVALWKPAGGPLLAPGTELIGVQVTLEDETRFLADMQVLHITPAGRSSGGGLRVGCDWRGMEAAAAETLQTWISRGRRRRDLVSLSFD